MKKINELSRGEKINQGGAWTGNFWLPNGATDADRASSEKYENGINENKTVRGFIRRVMAFNGQPRFSIMGDDGIAVLLPNWHSLMRDLKEGGMVDTLAELEFEGSSTIKNGAQKGKQAFNVGIYPIG